MNKQKMVIALIVIYLIISLINSLIVGNLTGFSQSSLNIKWLGMTVNPKNISIEGKLNPDDVSVDLNWTNLTSPSNYDIYYNIYYSFNISAIVNLDLNNISPNVSVFPNIITPNFTDHTAHLDQARYYTIGYVIYDIEQLTNDTPVGKFTYYYDAPVSSIYGTLASNRINPFLDLNYDAESFLQGIPGNLSPTISRLDKTDPAGEHLTTHVLGLSANNFPLVIGEAYQVTVDDYFNQTVVGDIYLPPYILNYQTLNSSIFGILASHWYGIFDFKKNYNAESFLQEIPGNLSPTISRLDKSDLSGEFLTTHVRNLSDGNNFTMHPGTGYVITADQNYTHTLCSSNCFT